jgi:hypothetical protein
MSVRNYELEITNYKSLDSQNIVITCSVYFFAKLRKIILIF